MTNINLYSEVLKQASIVDVLNYYGLNLHHNKCLCPFHNDTNPSLVVNPKKNIATCFSCQTTGNTISFVQKYEKLVNHNEITTNEAIAKVVDICNLNIDVSQINKRIYNNKYSVIARKYTDYERELLKVNENLNKLFCYNLSVSKEPKEYLKNRQITEEEYKSLNMGFAPKGQLLKLSEDNKNYPRSALLELGYLKYDDKGDLCETFSDRIMIPICDEKGNIVTFCGRTIKDEDPKYLHTSETKIFKKNELLYNFSNSKTLAYNNELILVEGYMDIIGAKKIGYKNVAALMGTSIAPEQLKLIKNNHSTITLALDNDSKKIKNAGKDAMIKYIPELIQQGFKVNVLDISKVGDYKDFGELGENEIPYEEIQKTKISGFYFLLDSKYFLNNKYDVESISDVYKMLKKDKLMNNTYDESLFKEYLLSKTSFNKNELDEILYPKKIEEKANSINSFTSKAMSNFLYIELKQQIEKMNDIVLSTYYENYKSSIENRLVSIFNKNPDSYLNYSNSTLNSELLLSNFLKDNKEYSDYESLNRFKYSNVFDKTFIKNSNGSARIKLKDSQRQAVIEQFENSLSDQSKLALEEVEELYIINSIDDIDGILNYDNNTLDLLKDNLKDRMFLNKNKMDFFKFGSLFPSINKDFIDDKFKGSTGNFKTILFYNNLDNNLNIGKDNIITDNEQINLDKTNINKSSISNNQSLNKDYYFSINKMLLVPSLETDTHYFVRIPGTEAKEYFYILKDECSWSKPGEVIFTRLKFGESYPIYNSTGEYIGSKSFEELKHNWDDKTNTEKVVFEENKTNQEVVDSTTSPSEHEIIYDNSYTSRYKDPVCKVYHSKIYLETEKGFYIKTDDPNVLLFAIKKICNWSDNKSYLIISPRKGFFNSGISKYRLQGFKKDFEKKLSYSEIDKYIKIFNSNDTKKKEIITIEIPKEKCSFNSNYIKIPLVIDNINGYIEVNLIKSKIDKQNVMLELSKEEQIGFHTKTGEYINHYSSQKIQDSYNEMILNKNIIQFPNNQNINYDVPEKEAA